MARKKKEKESENENENGMRDATYASGSGCRLTSYGRKERKVYVSSAGEMNDNTQGRKSRRKRGRRKKEKEE